MITPFAKLAAELAWPLATLLFVMLFVLAAAIVARRISRNRRFRRLDSARATVASTLGELETGRIARDEALARLQPLCTPGSRRTFEALLLSDVNLLPGRAPLLAGLCNDLGLTAHWCAILAGSKEGRRPRQRPASGRDRRRAQAGRPSLRSEAAELLGIVRHRPGWPLLAAALQDPSRAVRAAAIQALAQIREPESLPALAEALESALLNPGQRDLLQNFKMAVVWFPPLSAAPLGRLLQHPDQRVRTAAIEAIAGMLERASASLQDGAPEALTLPLEVEDMVATRSAVDEIADVRARAADVLGRLAPSTALPSLLGLANDAEWFVRLHATRALGRLPGTSNAALGERLLDRHWRVREAAAQSLAARGEPGIELLIEHLLTTTDRYSREQVAEQLERAGLIPLCLELLRTPDNAREADFERVMAQAGHGGAAHGALGIGPAGAPPETLSARARQDSHPTEPVTPRSAPAPVPATR